MRCCSSCFRGNDVTGSQSGSYDTLTSERPDYLQEELQSRFHCCGVDPQYCIYLKRHGMYEEDDCQEHCRSLESALVEDDCQEHCRSLERALEEDENDNFDVKILKPNVPYLDKLPADLSLGKSIEICGKTLENCNRFSINISTDIHNDSDLGLHFKPHFDRRIIIRNHRICKRWGPEEIASVHPFPFRMSKCFSIIIFIGDDQFMIAINKVHFCAFTFRIPQERLKYLIITGDIELHSIHHTIRGFYPPQIYSRVPYVSLPRCFDESDKKFDIRRKVNSISVGTKIQIFGRLKLLPRGFYVNIQEGLSLWPHPIIPFHMNLRIHNPGTHKREYEIIFNSWTRGFWEKESIISFCPFLPGTDFLITIDCNPTCYTVEVNDKLLFKHKRPTSNAVNAIVVHGDVIIRKVVLRKISTKLS